MNNYVLRKSFTFGEVLKNWLGESSDYISVASGNINTGLLKYGQSLASFSNQIFPNLVIEIAPSTYSSSFDDILQAIYNRYKDEFFIAYRKDYTPWDESLPDITDSEVQDILLKQMWILLNYIDKTSPKYRKLLALYTSAEDKLLDKLQTIVDADADTNGTSRFNDTPQNPAEEDEFAEDDYTTNLTKSNSHSESGSTTSYDEGTIMSRLDEIHRLYQNVMERWVGEFEKFFWEE